MIASRLQVLPAYVNKNEGVGASVTFCTCMLCENDYNS